MAFIESLADVDRELESALKKLQSFEDDVTDEQAWARLLHQSPRHPLVWMRPVFALGAGLCVVGAAGLFLLPFIEALLPEETRRELPVDSIRALEAAAGMPLPVSLGVLGVCAALMYVMCGQAALAIGREAPLLPSEAKQHEKLADDVKRLQAQRNTLARAEAAAMPKRLATPTPSTRVRAAGGAAQPEALVNFGSEPLVSFSDDSFVSFGSAPPAPLPVVERTKAFTPVPTSRVAGPPGAGAGNTPQPAPVAGGAAPPEDDGFGKRISTTFPEWGEMREPWLSESVAMATELAHDFPIQARLEFNAEAFLPFALVLRRATPAMAVRAVNSYVNFLAKIPTPPRARIELESVAHVDRNFRRSVLTALEPIFGDEVLVEGEGEVLDIQFTRPDRRWHDYPELPILR
jgi:hypothetical protein